MHQDEELHDQLMAEFRRYFAANQQWMNEATKASAIRLRQSLSEIRRICSARRVAVREWAIEKEAILAEKEARRQAQKRQAKQEANDT
jgi:hypothetical protein